MSPAEQLRRFVVRTVILAIVGLTFLLYGFVGYLLQQQGQDAVPDALWLAAGAQAGILGSILLNSKGDRDAVTIEQPPDEPVPVANVA